MLCDFLAGSKLAPEEVSLGIVGLGTWLPVTFSVMKTVQLRNGFATEAQEYMGQKHNQTK